MWTAILIDVRYLLDTFSAHCCALLHQLVPADLTGFAAVDPARRVVVSMADPAELLFPGVEACFTHEKALLMGGAHAHFFESLPQGGAILVESIGCTLC